MDTTNKKIDGFLGYLEERTIKSIDGDFKIKESCTATLLLIFAVIDSLSKITCTDPDYAKFRENRGGNKDRFQHFLENVMGGPYARFQDPPLLYELRCDIVHTGIKEKVIFSKDIHAHHLEEIDGFFWINTDKFLDDLKEAVRKIRQDIEAKGTYWQNAARRLRDFNIIEIDIEPMPSLPPDEEPFR